MNEMNCTMKKKNANRALVLSMVSLCLFGLSLCLSWVLSSVQYAVFLSVLLFIPSVVLLCKSEKKEKYSFGSLILNSLANGFVVSIYYMKIQKSPVLFDYLVLLLPAALVLLAYLLFGYLRKGRLWYTLLLIILHCVLFAVTVVRWVRIGGVCYSLAFFGLIFSLLYGVVFALSLHRSDRTPTRAVAIGSFGILGLVAVIVILLVSDGEGIDGLFDGLGELIAEAFTSREKPQRH